MQTFEIGRVYKTNTRKVYLAIDLDKAVSFYDGVERPLTKATKGPLVAVEATSQDLCDLWRVSWEQLDAFTERNLYVRCPKNPAQPTRGSGIRSRNSTARKYLPTVHRFGSLSGD